MRDLQEGDLVEVEMTGGEWYLGRVLAIRRSEVDVEYLNQYLEPTGTTTRTFTEFLRTNPHLRITNAMFRRAMWQMKRSTSTRN